MEEIVYEVIGGAIILGIILLVIGVFRQGTTTIRDSVKTQADADDIRMEELVGVSGGTYSGAKIKEAYSYAAVSNEYIEVWVKNGGNINHVLNDATAENYLQSGNQYQLQIGYYDEVDKTTPVLTDAHFKPEAKQSDTIAMIRFVFVKK